MYRLYIFSKEEFEDTKGVIRICISKKVSILKTGRGMLILKRLQQTFQH